ncbi:hypothetical protein HK097_008301 [Rhizophlyctis rosea]|uniref:SH3 domain-containing protein n=1 Tax=Rhizophlyctis rosea TaxID=64517 RepID=A0AAD5X5D2_9FUNG|nr:hypothetical protein HK097_008301 [Rhizophlyctis rosea]
MDVPQTRLVTTAGYDPVQPDEMKLSVGDVVVVLHSYDDGWIYGRNLSTSAMGLVPRNFLKSEAPAAFTQPSNSPKPTSSPSPTANSPSSPVNVKIPNRIASMDLSAAGITISNGSPPATVSSSPTNTRKVPMKTDGPTSVKPAEPVTAEEAKKKLQMAKAWRTQRAPVPANIGAVKIMVVGDSGIGKTALIHSLISLTSPNPTKPPILSPTTSLHSIPTSTIPPTELRYHEDPQNLTFIDTPGYGTSIDAYTIMKPTIDHITQQFQQTSSCFSQSINPTQLTKFLSTGAGAHTHVDICLYGILHRVTPVDVEYMKRISTITNLVPVLLKCDTLSAQEIYRLKTDLLDATSRAQIELYKFGLSHGECLALAKARVGGAIPFAISSIGVIDGGNGVGNGVGGVDETEEMGFNLFYGHLEDLRRKGAEKFVGWRGGGRK